MKNKYSIPHLAILGTFTLSKLMVMVLNLLKEEMFSDFIVIVIHKFHWLGFYR